MCKELCEIKNQNFKMESKKLTQNFGLKNKLEDLTPRKTFF